MPWVEILTDSLPTPIIAKKAPVVKENYNEIFI